MALRRSDHALDQAPVRLLELGTPGKFRLGVAQAQGEGVADPLKLAGREHSRAADRADPPFEPGTGEGGGEELAESAVEIRYLTPQVVTGAPLGASRDGSAECLGA